MFAPNHHPAMKNVAPVRKELGVRTIFNILGPLTNPAGAPNILMGVFHPDLVGIQVRALQRLGAEHALVVYGRDGMDEVSPRARPPWSASSRTARSASTRSIPRTSACRWRATARCKVETPEQSKADAARRARQPAGRGARHRGASTPASALVRGQRGRDRSQAGVARGARRHRVGRGQGQARAADQRCRKSLRELEGHVRHPGQDRRGQARGNRGRAEEECRSTPCARMPKAGC